MNEKIQTSHQITQTTQEGWAPGRLQKRIATICMILPVPMLIAAGAYLLSGPRMAGFSFYALLDACLLFIAGVRLFLDPVSIFSVIFTVLAALPFIFFVILCTGFLKG